jgi:hypothetical protein
MTTLFTRHPRLVRILRRLQRTRSELSYVNRRLFEIRTGLPPATPTFSISADELERRFQLGSA